METLKAPSWLPVSTELYVPKDNSYGRHERIGGEGRPLLFIHAD